MMKEQSKQLKAIRSLLENKPIEENEEESEDTEQVQDGEDSAFPDLFSLRKSPLYQAKIVQR